MDEERLKQLFEFFLELDKEKFIGRQTYLHDGIRKENDAEHAWHMAVMAILLSDYATEKIDVLKAVTMILLHDVVEIDAGDAYAYDAVAQSTQAEKEEKAAKRIYGILPKELGDRLYGLWREFEERSTPEARFARAMDNIQPLMLNAATDGKAWEEHGIDVSQVLKRNQRTAEGSRELWDYCLKSFIVPNVEKGRLTDNTNSLNNID
jgi:putative hydrolase of HD superfamily